MKNNDQHQYCSHGNGRFIPDDFNEIGNNVIFEDNVLVFHPENIIIGSNVYIGHNTILKGYYKNEMTIGNHTWIGQGCFFHSAGGLAIGSGVGIGPMVKIITSAHNPDDPEDIVMHNELLFEKVTIEDGSDLGIGSIILPGVRIGKGAIVGAGSVVTKDVQDFSIVVGIPAKTVRKRKQ